VLPVHRRRGHQQPDVEAGATAVDGDLRVVEAQPAARERIPGLVDGLLGREEHGVPRHAGVGAAQRSQLVALGPGCHQRQHTLRQRRAGLRVDAEAEDLRRSRHGRCAIPRAMGDAADDARRPQRLAGRPLADGRRLNTEPGQGQARAVPAGRELLPSRSHRGVGDGPLLVTELDAGDVGEELHRAHGSRQDVADHARTVDSTARPCRLAPCRACCCGAGRPRAA
jgi:hypothetical protein